MRASPARRLVRRSCHKSSPASIVAAARLRTSMGAGYRTSTALSAGARCGTEGQRAVARSGRPMPREVGSSAGVSDPTGRGRQTAFLRSGPGGTVDLVVTNAPARVDGWPSPAGSSGPSATGSSPRSARRASRRVSARWRYSRPTSMTTVGTTCSSSPVARRHPVQLERVYRDGGRGLVDITGRGLVSVPSASSTPSSSTSTETSTSTSSSSARTGPRRPLAWWPLPGRLRTTGQLWAGHHQRGRRR